MSVGTIGVIGGAMVGAPAEPAESWTRPAEWPAVPESQANELHGIVAVHDVPLGAIIAFSVTVAGGYTVDWGDGTVDNVASGVTAEHIYDYDNVNLPAALADGSKLAVVSVYSTTPGAAWTAVFLDKRHSSLTRQTAQGWIEWDINAPGLTSALDVRGEGAEVSVLNARAIVPIIQSTAFGNYNSLKSVHLDVLGNNANLSYCFSNCSALVRARLYGTENVTNFSRAFTGNTTLTDINSPLATDAATSLEGLFYECRSLLEVPVLTVQNGANIQSMLGRTNVAHFPEWLSQVEVSSARSLLYENTHITSAEVTVSGSAQALCDSAGAMKKVKVMGKPTSLRQFVYSAPAIADIEVVDASAVTDTYLFAGNNPPIQRLILGGLSVSIDCGFLLLSATALNDLFTSLGTAVGQTVTVKGNPGAATCDTSIATAKGWTVVTA